MAILTIVVALGTLAAVVPVGLLVAVLAILTVILAIAPVRPVVAAAAFPALAAAAAVLVLLGGLPAGVLVLSALRLRSGLLLTGRAGALLVLLTTGGTPTAAAAGGLVLTTLLLGVVGALLGGWLGGLIFNAPLQDFFSLQTWLLAIGGSILVLLIYGLIVGRKSKA